jgi:DNA-directed RNA polymerase specialized sigma24 family protein
MNTRTPEKLSAYLAGISDPIDRWEAVQSLAEERKVLSEARMEIVAQLQSEGWSISETADALGISRSRVYNLRVEGRARK